LVTGSGKTLIACLLIRHVIEKELELQAAGNRPRVSFFLVHSVTLVFQQAAVLRCNIDARIGEYCGNMGAGDWKRETWDDVLGKQQVPLRYILCRETIADTLTRSLLLGDRNDS